MRFFPYNCHINKYFNFGDMLLLFARVRCLLVATAPKKLTTICLDNFRRFKYENSGKTACSDFFTKDQKCPTQ